MAPQRRTSSFPRDSPRHRLRAKALDENFFHRVDGLPLEELQREMLHENFYRRAKGLPLVRFDKAVWLRAVTADSRRRPMPEMSAATKAWLAPHGVPVSGPTHGAQRLREQARHGGQASGVARRKNADRVRRAIDKLRRKSPRLTIRDAVHRYLMNDRDWGAKPAGQRRTELNAAVRRYRRAHERAKKPKKQ